MKTIAMIFFASFFLFGVVNATETADAPQYKVGDMWKISVGNPLTKKEIYWQNEVVTKIENDFVFYKVGNYSSATSTLDGNRISFSNPKRGDEQIFDPSGKSLFFPLSVGKTWKAPYKAKINGNISLEGELEVKIVSFEKRTVPAGTFDTFKFEAVTDFIGNGPGWTYQGKYVSTYWYAPKAKRIIESEFVKYVNGRVDVNETTTMISYSLAD